MKNAVVKGFVKIGLLAVVTIIAASASAKAQSLEYRLTANIPFDFSVGNEKFSAGKYYVGRAQQSQGDTILQVRRTDGSTNAVGLTIPTNSHRPTNEASLVFHRYGNEYFLSQVWPKGGVTGRELPKSHAERELARKTQDNKVAALKGPEVTTVIIRASY